MNTIRVEDGLVKYRNTFPGGPVAFFADLTQQTVVIKNVVYVLQTLLADGVVVSLNFYMQLESIWSHRSCSVEDLSVLCCMAISLGHHPTEHAVVQCCRLVRDHAHDSRSRVPDVASK